MEWKAASIGGLGIMNRWMGNYLPADGPFKFVRVFDSPRHDPERDAAREHWQSHGATLVQKGNYEALIGDGVDVVTICMGKNLELTQVLPRLVAVMKARCGERSPLIFDMTTLSPRCVRLAFQFCQAQGIQYVNAPLTGGPKGAQEGKMLILYGGPQQLFGQLSGPFLSKIGTVPERPFGENPEDGAKVKMQGQIGVFGSLSAICGSVAMDTMAFREGQLGGKAQADFFDFLNNGAGGMRQWVVAVSLGVREDVWTGKGFLNPHAAVDAAYAAQCAAEFDLSRRQVIDPLCGTVVALGHVMKQHGMETATHCLVRELYGDRARELDRAVDASGYLKATDAGSAIKCAVDSLPEQVRKTVMLDISADNFTST